MGFWNCYASQHRYSNIYLVKAKHSSIVKGLKAPLFLEVSETALSSAHLSSK